MNEHTYSRLINLALYPRSHIAFFFFTNFQETLDTKNSTIKDLQYELARACKVSNVFKRLNGVEYPRVTICIPIVCH